MGGNMPATVDELKFRGYYVELNPKIDNLKALDFALKKLKKMIKDSDMMLDIQRTQEFTKPSAIKREKKSKARARQRSETKRLCR